MFSIYQIDLSISVFNQIELKLVIKSELKYSNNFCSFQICYIRNNMQPQFY